MIITVILPLQCHGFCYCSRGHTVCCIRDMWAHDIYKKRSVSAWKRWPENLREKSVLYEQLL